MPCLSSGSTHALSRICGHVASKNKYKIPPFVCIVYPICKLSLAEDVLRLSEKTNEVESLKPKQNEFRLAFMRNFRLKQYTD